MSGIRTSVPMASGLMMRNRYSYWKKRRMPACRSAGWDPVTTSNGDICTTALPRRDSSTTTDTASDSSTAQVSDTSNCSPTWTAGALVRHQQRIGSTDTSRVPVSRAGAGWAPASAARPRRREAVSSSRLLMSFPQASFDDEFTEGDIRLVLVEPDHDDIQVEFAGVHAHALLPFARAVGELGVLAPGD